MSYSAPFTAVAGTAWTAANWNTYGRDNIAWLATDSPACRVYHNTTQSIANITNKSLVFNSERFDNAAMHSTSSNTARITVPTGGGGKYLMGCNLAWASAIQFDMWFELNGTDVSTTNVSRTTWDSGKGFLDTVYALSAADFVTASVLQVTGGSVNVSSTSPYTPEYWAFWYRT